MQTRRARRQRHGVTPAAMSGETLLEPIMEDVCVREPRRPNGLGYVINFLLGYRGACHWNGMQVSPGGWDAPKISAQGYLKEQARRNKAAQATTLALLRLSQRACSSRTMARRIGVMADGRIGRVAVELLVRSYPDCLHALVTTGASFQDELLPDNCRRFSWRHLSEGSADALSTCNLDVLILAWWPHLLRGPLLEVAPTILNTHPSLLPYGRGKDPNFWAIVEQVPFGVTIHHVDATTDGGDIAFQQPIPVTWEDTGGTLYSRALTAMEELLERSLPIIVAGQIPRIPQGSARAPRLRRELDPASELHLGDEISVRDLLN